jgi:hypothetical protein
MEFLLVVLIYPLPFSSLPKYLVHFSLRASRLNAMLLFLHLLESNHRIVPSFLTYIMPVPAGKSAPQNEHFLGFGMTNSPSYLSGNFLCFSLSFSQHQNVLCSDWSFDVACDDSAFVFAFHDADADLCDFACYACAAYDLYDF